MYDISIQVPPTTVLTSLDQFEQFQTSLDKFGQVWTSLDKFGQVYTLSMLVLHLTWNHPGDDDCSSPCNYPGPLHVLILNSLKTCHNHQISLVDVLQKCKICIRFYSINLIWFDWFDLIWFELIKYMPKASDLARRCPAKNTPKNTKLNKTRQFNFLLAVEIISFKSVKI